MKKIIDLPMVFNAEIWPKRARKTKMVNVVSMEPFEIDDLSDNIPKIVAYEKNIETIREQNGYFFIPKQKRIQFQNAYSTSETNLLNDEKHLYSQNVDWKNNGFGTKRIILNDIEKPSENPDLSYIDRLSHILPFLTDDCIIPSFNTKTDNMIYEYDVKKYISDNRMAVINRCQNELKNNVLINGQLFEKTDIEPVAIFNPENCRYLKIIWQTTLNSYNNFLLQTSLRDACNIICSDSQMIVLNPDVFNESDINTMAFNIFKKMQISFNNIIQHISSRHNITEADILNTIPEFQELMNKFNECEILHEDNSMTMEHIKNLYPYLRKVAQSTPLDTRKESEHNVFTRPEAYYGSTIEKISGLSNSASLKNSY